MESAFVSPLTPHTCPYPQAAPPARGRTPRSCQLCNRRKVRCDRKRPCSHCTRAGKACLYPQARQATATVPLQPGRGGSPSATGRQRSPARASPGLSVPQRPATANVASDVASEAVGGGPADEILVDKGHGSQYFNEILHSQAIEEGREPSAESRPSGAPPRSPKSSSRDAMAILFASPASVPPYTLHPSKSAAFSLWNLYVENVEYCSMRKVLHIPTDEVRIYTTIDDPSRASSEDLALCFAVYYASMNSVKGRDGTSVCSLLKQDSTVDLARFKLGFAQSLAGANFLDNPTITSLKSVTIYLSALRDQSRGLGIWSLSGLVIRLARSVGLHRDGELLGLPPFESELRRRLWWQLVTRDSRAGEDYGQNDSNDLAITSDVAEPVNVDDNELYPNMAERPKPRTGFTSITFNNINIDFAKAQERLASLLRSSTPGKPPPESTRIQIIAEMSVQVEERLLACNPAIPRQRLMLVISRFVLRKIDLTSRLQWLALGAPRGSPMAMATDGNLAEAVDVLDSFLTILGDDMLQPYVWSTEAFPQHYVLLYVLWHLCVRPEGDFVQRTWDVLALVFESSLWEITRQPSDITGALLERLRSKAEAQREKQQAGDDALNLRLQGRQSHDAVITNAPSAGEVTYPLEGLGNMDNGFGGDSNALPDWTSLLAGWNWIADAL